VRTLKSAADLQTVVQRISTLTPSDKPVWGRMTVGQMVCHVYDSYRIALGEKPVSVAPVRVPRPVYKWLALRLPMKWPKGVPTRPEVEQGVGGTAPAEFAADRAELLSVLARFCDTNSNLSLSHPIFGEMTSEDWLRWGYLHADHHLRQFGR
jgi:hypothetical protein